MKCAVTKPVVALRLSADRLRALDSFVAARRRSEMEKGLKKVSSRASILEELINRELEKLVDGQFSKKRQPTLADLRQFFFYY